MNASQLHSTMKMVGVISLAAALLAPGWVLGDEPAPQVTPTPEEAKPVPEARPLATVEAILDYCARLDAAASDKYRQQAGLVSQGADEETLARIRETDEYRQAHGEMDEFLAKVDARNAKKVCAQRLVQNP